jgi:GNAT superfamily N-acetyltransferase
MPVSYRTAQAHELEHIQALIIASINDLTTRHGLGPMASVRPPHFQTFSLGDDPDGLWVAEDGGDLIGSAFSWVCGDLWFLAELFVAPEHQGRGIGAELLKRTLHHAEKSGAANKALITFTFNTVSQALYVRHGMFPRTPIYNLSAATDVVLGRLQGDRLRTVPLESSESHLQHLDRNDARALGVSRRKHHRFLLTDRAVRDTVRGLLLYDGSSPAGYAYVSSTGHIGPLAVIEPGALGPAFRTALHAAAETGASQLSAFVPGAADLALQITIPGGMRISFPMLLMSSRDVGDWRQYLPRNPGFM